MSAKVSTFSRGITFTSSGETGTQANEFEAAIKSVTSATTVGAVFVYDTRNDSDGGAWRKKCQGLSWFDETLNTATRGGRREFPSVALIVGDNDASGNTVTIYDLDDPAMPMWMVFNAHTAAWETNAAFVSTSTLTSVHALNGRMYVGGEYGLVEIDFLTEQQTNFRPISSTQRVRHKKSGAIVDRNDTSGQFRITATPIANNTVNDVAAKYLEGGELDSLGLVRPVVACATAGGVSVIHPNGSVYDIAGTGQTHDDIHDVFFTDDNMIGYGFEASSSITHSWAVALRRIPFADESIGGWTNTTNLERYMPTVGGATTGITTIAEAYTDSGTTVNAVTPTGKYGLALGYNDQLSIVKRNPANMEEGAVAYITSLYNTGYMLGDIRGAWLAGHYTLDRSVKGNTLTHNGSLTAAVVATGAEQWGYSGFSASNYLSRANDTDFDFGTGDFSVMFWFKGASSGTEMLFSRGTASTATHRWYALLDSSQQIQFYIWGSSGTTNITSSAIASANWNQAVVMRKSGKLHLYVNGNSVATPVANAVDLDSGSAALLAIGTDAYSVGTNSYSGSLSLVRISATAPTPQQVKEMYEAEKPLFRAGAKCLLSQVSFNDVNDLAYDNSSDLLYVGTKSGDAGDSVSTFRGLERVDTKDGQDLGWDGASAQFVAAAGGVVGYARTVGSATGSGLVLDLPAIDVRGDINTADTKLPDDGKLHFTGVTTDATVTTIGQIPVAANEVSNVKVRVNGCKYNASDSSYRLNGEINQSFSRNMTGNVAEETEGMKLVESDAASTDIDLVADTSAQTIQVKVTGISATRMQWNAEVEVQRISEKTYER